MKTGNFQLVLALFITFLEQIVYSFNASDPIWKTNFDSHNHDVVAFYHVWANEGSGYHSVVEQQLDVLDNSGLFDKLEKIFYTTSGDKGKFFRIQNDKFHYLNYFGNEGEEYETLGLVYRFCHSHPKTKVLYFHDRHEGTGDFRNILDCFVLNPTCIDSLDKYETCGWRLSPLPFIHYIGNFWWAKCHYVNKLIDPLSIKLNSTFIEETTKLSDCVGSHEKSFSESWVGSYPKINAADCMNASIDFSYLAGTKVPPVAHTYCPNSDGKYGFRCDEPSAYKYPKLFSGAFNEHKMIAKAECQRDLDSEINKRSEIWYGQPASWHTEWTTKLKNLPVFKDGDAIRGARSKQVWYYKDNCLHAIPNGNVFYSLGLDFANVIAIPEYQLESYKVCAPM
jgi:hypothetical protein